MEREPTPHITPLDIARQLVGDVVETSVYTPDLDWDIWFAVQQLEEQNALPESMTGEDVFNAFVRTFHYE